MLDKNKKRTLIRPKNIVLENRYQESVERNKNLSASNKFGEFVSEQFLLQEMRKRKVTQKRVILSAHKIKREKPQQQQFQPYEQDVALLPKPRKLNTGLMLSTIKQSMYGQAAPHV